MQISADPSNSPIITESNWVAEWSAEADMASATFSSFETGWAVLDLGAAKAAPRDLPSRFQAAWNSNSVDRIAGLEQPEPRASGETRAADFA